MIYQLQPDELTKARPLFDDMEYHLAPLAVIGGVAEGIVYVDNLASPNAAFVWTGHRFYLAGDPNNADFNADVRRLFEDEIYSQLRAAGSEAFVLYSSSEAWESAIESVILRGRRPLSGRRDFYAFGELDDDWREALPEGYTVQQIDAEVVVSEQLENLEQMTEEMQSEAPSVEAFLERCFGFYALKGDEIAGWCMSEYNWENRCEVGIETVEEHRGQGLATATASALIEHALAQGIDRIGWHCWADNEPSVATALKVGFEKEQSYSVFMILLDEVINLAVHGNGAFRREDYDEALDWYKLAMESGEPPAWVHWNAACASARVGERQAAFGYLDQAIDKGLRDVEMFTGSEHLEDLHEDPRWQALVERLERPA